MIYKEQRKPGFWDRIRKNPGYAEIIDILKNDYSELLSAGILPLSREDFDRYFETGERKPFEDAYFSRRALLERAFVLSLLYPERREYVDTAVSVIAAICGEYSWVVPAHSGAHKVDLFSSETALLITECISFLGDRIDKSAAKSAIEEVYNRVIKVYEENEFVWEKYTSNWSAVCTGCVATAMIYAFPDSLERNLERIIKTQELFLSGFSDEGVSFEGAGYWKYGFGNFVWLADALFDHTNGRVNLFDLPKAKAVAAYPRYAVLCGGAFVTFSDSARVASFSKALINCIKLHYPQMSMCLNGAGLTFVSTRANTQNFVIRNFFFADTDSIPEEKAEDYWLPSAGQMIFNRDNYSFAIKAGDNAELHNHNDVGSFIFADKAGQALCDLGCGYYNRDYFGEKRYDILCNSSFGHSVPIINGKPQKAGKEYSGTVLREGNTVILNIEKAYGIPELSSLKRTVTADENGIILTDEYTGDTESFVDRFVTLRKPQIYGDGIKLGDTIIKFDKSAVKVNFAEVLNKKHNGEFETVYLLDFTAGDKSRSLAFKIEALQ